MAGDAVPNPAPSICRLALSSHSPGKRTDVEHPLRASRDAMARAQEVAALGAGPQLIPQMARVTDDRRPLQDLWENGRQGHWPLQSRLLTKLGTRPSRTPRRAPA
jgi:hypothetical protein